MDVMGGWYMGYMGWVMDVGTDVDDVLCDCVTLHF